MRPELDQRDDFLKKYIVDFVLSLNIFTPSHRIVGRCDTSKNKSNNVLGEFKSLKSLKET